MIDGTLPSGNFPVGVFLIPFFMSDLYLPRNAINYVTFIHVVVFRPFVTRKIEASESGSILWNSSGVLEVQPGDRFCNMTAVF